MVIGVLTTSYPRVRGDFAGAFVADRVETLRSGGHEVEVLAGGHAAPIPAVEQQGVRVTRLPSSFGGGPDLFEGAGAPEELERGGAPAFLSALRFSAALASAVAARAARWDRVESHWLAPCALAGLAGAPHLAHRAHAHSGDVALLERVPFGRTLARALARSSAEIVFVSESLRSRFARLAGRSVGRVELPPVSSLFARAVRPDLEHRRRLGIAGPVIVSTGRLVPIKGYDLLLRACAAQPVRPPGLPPLVVLVGDGPARADLAALARRLGVALRLPGRLSREGVAAWLRAADLYVQPSRVLANGRTEGMPVGTLEALAVGLPVVASDCGGLSELPRFGAGVALFPAGDSAALSRLIGAQLSRMCVVPVTPA